MPIKIQFSSIIISFDSILVFREPVSQNCVPMIKYIFNIVWFIFISWISAVFYGISDTLCYSHHVQVDFLIVTGVHVNLVTMENTMLFLFNYKFNSYYNRHLHNIQNNINWQVWISFYVIDQREKTKLEQNSHQLKDFIKKFG